MNKARLRWKLQKKLTIDQIEVFQNVVIYCDRYKITRRQSNKEQEVVKEYLANLISEKIGCPVKITRWRDSETTYFAHYFKRL